MTWTPFVSLLFPFCLQRIITVSKSFLYFSSEIARYILRYPKVVCKIQCVRKVAVYLGYGRVQLKCDGIRWRTRGEVRTVAVHLGYSRVQLKCDGTRWRTRGEVRTVAVHLGYSRVQLKCDGTRWRTRGEVRTLAVHLGYSRVQLKCDGRRWRTGGEVRKVAVHLGYGRVQLKCDGTQWRTRYWQPNLRRLPLTGYPLHSLFSTSLPLPCGTECHHSSTGLYCSLSAQQLSERTVYLRHD